MSTEETTTPPAATVAGWYPHPGGVPQTEMYWDGTQWDVTAFRPMNPYAELRRREYRENQASIHRAGPMTSASLNVNREVSYVRQQKGHSLLLHLFIIGPFTLWIPAIYFTVSPNHYWHA